MSFLTMPRTRLGAALATLVLVAGGLGVASRSNGAITATRAVTDQGVVNVTTNLAYDSGSAAGTGMVLTSTGRVLTNNHVIRGATTIRVSDPRSGRSYSATVLGYSVGADVALLQLKSATSLSTVSTGDSSKVRIGQRVTALGNAGGVGGTPSSASGVVTGLNQSIVVSDERGGTARLTNLIRIDAALQPGDSGGPLVNSSGRVIGMNTAASVGFQFQSTGQGYATPINRALTIVKQISAKRSSATVHVGPTPFLGIGLSSSRPGLGSGAFVTEVAPNSPAARAGLSVGSLITRIDGRAVSSADQLTTLLLRHKAGESVTLHWIDRLGGSHTKSVKTVAGPPQ
jgi:S1-C subfamily serine protease